MEVSWFHSVQTNGPLLTKPAFWHQPPGEVCQSANASTADCLTGKKVGNAVKRNRSRRIIREAFRLFEPILKEKTQKRYDFVFVARSKTPELKSTKIYSLMMKNILSRLS